MNELFEKKILAELLNVPVKHVKYVSGYPIQPDDYADTFEANGRYYEIVLYGSFDIHSLMEIHDVTCYFLDWNRRRS